MASGDFADRAGAGSTRQGCQFTFRGRPNDGVRKDSDRDLCVKRGV